MTLTPDQQKVLILLACHNVQRDGALSGPEVSRLAGRRAGYWAGGKLSALEKRGLVARLGSTMSGGQCWNITDAGRRALAEAGDKR